MHEIVFFSEFEMYRPNNPRHVDFEYNGSVGDDDIADYVRDVNDEMGVWYEWELEE